MEHTKVHPSTHTPDPISPAGDPESSDSDLDSDDGDKVLSRGYPRDLRNLVANGFRPVWTANEEYPDKNIPLDILEFLDEDGTRRKSSNAFMPAILPIFR